MSDCPERDPETGVPCMLTAEPHDEHVAHVRWSTKRPTCDLGMPDCTVDHALELPEP